MRPALPLPRDAGVVVSQHVGATEALGRRGRALGHGTIDEVSRGRVTRLRLTTKPATRDRGTIAVMGAGAELPEGLAYLLSGKARWSWQHSIPATKQLRYSVTFRTLKRAGSPSASA